MFLTPGVWNTLFAPLEKKYLSSLGTSSKLFEIITIARNALISDGVVCFQPVTSFLAAFLFVNSAICSIISLSKKRWKYSNAECQSRMNDHTKSASRICFCLSVNNFSPFSGEAWTLSNWRAEQVSLASLIASLTLRLNRYWSSLPLFLNRWGSPNLSLQTFQLV